MSKKSGLYFSMQRRNETQEAWLRRTEPAFRHSNHFSGLSGKPNKQGIDKDKDKFERLPDGRLVEVVRKGYGWRAAKSVEAFARRQGLAYLEYNGNGCSGMCKRIDGIAFVDAVILEKRSADSGPAGNAYKFNADGVGR